MMTTNYHGMWRHESMRWVWVLCSLADRRVPLNLLSLKILNPTLTRCPGKQMRRWWSPVCILISKTLSSFSSFNEYIGYWSHCMPAFSLLPHSPRKTMHTFYLNKYTGTHIEQWARLPKIAMQVIMHTTIPSFMAHSFTITQWKPMSHNIFSTPTILHDHWQISRMTLGSFKRRMRKIWSKKKKKE